MGICWTQHAWDFQAFVKQVVTTMEEGQALWYLIENKRIFLQSKEIPTGSFRWNAHIIASVVGGDYMDYYCASEKTPEWNGFTLEAKQRVEKKLHDLGVELRDIV